MNHDTELARSRVHARIIGRNFGIFMKPPTDKNPSLQPKDNFTYLRAELESDALNWIDRLERTNENYDVAVNMLKERFGNDKLIINSHYMWDILENIDNLPIAYFGEYRQLSNCVFWRIL